MASDAHALGHAGHAPGLQHQFDDMAQQRESLTLGMWLFLATEVMMFGGLFFTYSLYRGMFDGAFHEGCKHLNITLGTYNTFVLLFSSLTMAMAVYHSTKSNKGKTAGYLLVTWLLGAAFLVIKAFEWEHDWHLGLIPGLNWTFYDDPGKLMALPPGTTPHQVQMYFTVYFCMAGLHAIHMIAGLIVVGWFIVLTLKGHFLNGNEQPVEIVGLYWHIIDIIWIFLFPLLYLIAGFHPGGGAH